MTKSLDGVLPERAGASIVNLNAFKAQRVQLYRQAIEVQQAAQSAMLAIPSTEGLALAARLVEDVAYSFATCIPEQEVVELLQLAAGLEKESCRLDDLTASAP